MSKRGANRTVTFYFAANRWRRNWRAKPLVREWKWSGWFCIGIHYGSGRSRVLVWCSVWQRVQLLVQQSVFLPNIFCWAPQPSSPCFWVSHAQVECSSKVLAHLIPAAANQTQSLATPRFQVSRQDMHPHFLEETKHLTVNCGLTRDLHQDRESGVSAEASPGSST